MNTEVKRNIIEAPSNELLYQIEVHNGLIPAYIVKKHDGSIPYIHTKESERVPQWFHCSGRWSGDRREVWPHADEGGSCGWSLATGGVAGVRDTKLHQKDGDLPATKLVKHKKHCGN